MRVKYKTGTLLSALLALCATILVVPANANSVGFTTTDAFIDQGVIVISVGYDFSEFAMFGGGVDLFYDSTVVEFVSYTQSELPADAQGPASPVGALAEPGSYLGAGIGTFEFFNGMTSSGTIGTFMFNLIGNMNTGTTPCGATLCLQVSAINPFVSLAGDEVSAELLGNGITSVNIVVPFPVPAAVWFMLSGLGALVGFGRRKDASKR